MMRRIQVGLTMAACCIALQSQAATPTPVAAERDLTPYAIGAGAIAGVLVFNVLALGVAALPAAAAYGGAVAVPAEMSVAMSRVYAVSSAVAGGLLADYYYGR